MRWTYLGHAMWLLRVGELRVLFDPLVAPTHHGDVFEARPRRELDLPALAPDFIVVSHRHPDHFDVPSLHRLAALDPDTVLLTSDELVERTATALGFSNVARIDALHRIELESAQLFTTPSYGAEIEWGVMVATDDGVAYNQVDSVMRNDEDVRRTLTQAAEGLGRPALRERLELGLLRWQPLREVEAALAAEAGFPLDEHATLLEQIAAMNPSAVVPAAAGTAHAAPYDAMNRVVYPLPEARFRRDLKARLPATEVFAGEVGATFVVEGGEVGREGGLAPFVAVEGPPVPQRFEPYALPPLVDHDERAAGPLRERALRWLQEALLPALAAAYPSMGSPDAVRLALDLVSADETRRLGFVVDGTGARRSDLAGDDYDLLNAIACSHLVDVAEGRRHWGEPLLAGQLRVSQRGYRVGPEGLRPLTLAPVFLYYALSYEESHERWVDHQLAELG